MEAIPKKQVKYFAYAMAWLTYIGAFCTRAGNIGNVIRDSFNDIHVPKKDDYY